MTTKPTQYSVDLSHNQLSLLHTLLLNYRYTWRDKGDNIMPQHVDDLLQSTLHQLVTCRKQTSKLG